MHDVLYLHGLGASPRTPRAQLFAERLPRIGLRVIIPDLNRPSFFGLTTARALRVARGVLDAASGRQVIVGWSFGARVAAQAALAAPDRVAGLVLIAPAFEIQRSWAQSLGPKRMAAWKESGRIMVESEAHERPMPLGWPFYAEARATDGPPRLPPALPALVFHAPSDPIVPIGGSRRFVEQNPQAKLVELGSDHELADQTLRIFARMEPFLHGRLCR